jgi:predicted ArsR family transcriptional regulator
MSDAVITPAGLRIIKLLAGRPPRTVAELIDATEVTRTAVMEQLAELEAAGFVDRTIERLPGRGRPRHLYRATDAAMTLVFPGNPHVVMPALWRAVFEVGGEELTRKVAKRLSRAIADYYNSRITVQKPQERLRQLLALFAADGELTDLAEEGDGRWTLYRRSCPFCGMADDRRNVCRVDQEMIGAVVGRPVRRTACRESGSPCCTFELVEQ